jgi:hypothetical protein
MAGELGFEPRQTESESVVLPLHHSPRCLNNIRDLIGILAVLATEQATPDKAWRRSTRLGPGLASSGRSGCFAEPVIGRAFARPGGSR